jgi:hypothetical protein
LFMDLGILLFVMQGKTSIKVQTRLIELVRF